MDNQIDLGDFWQQLPNELKHCVFAQQIEQAA